MPKVGFKNQWIAISQKGKFNDSEGNERDLNDSFLKEVIANFTPNDAPAVIGHPKENAPAFGWATALRLNGDVLEAQFADTNDDFEEMVEKGLFRKRSASFYLNPARLRHVGFLGAQPPAVKGLRDIQFSDGDFCAVEISFKEQTMSKENENSTEEKKTFREFMKELFGGGEQQPAPTANFSEAERQKLIDDAVAKASEQAKADFAEQLKTRDEQIKTLTEAVNANSASGKRSEIVSFVESIPAEKGKHYLKRAGITEFLETLANDDAKDTEKAINFSEGEGDQKVEHKFSRLEWAKELFSNLPPMIEFGEKFGNIVATEAAGSLVDPARQKVINDAVNAKEAGGNE